MVGSELRVEPYAVLGAWRKLEGAGALGAPTLRSSIYHPEDLALSVTLSETPKGHPALHRHPVSPHAPPSVAKPGNARNSVARL